MESINIFTLIYISFWSMILLLTGQKNLWLFIGLIFSIPFMTTFIHMHYIVIYSSIIHLILSPKGINIKNKKISTINIALYLFFFICLISGFFSTNKFQAFLQIIELVYYFTFFNLISNIYKIGGKYYEVLLLTFLASFLISFIIQIMQVLGIEQFNIYSEDLLNPNTKITPNSEFVRFWGPFGNSLTYSCYLAIVGIFLYVNYDLKKANKTIVLSKIVLLITLLAIILTVSRTALFSVIVAYPLYQIIINKKYFQTLIFIPLISLLAIFFININTFGDFAIISRIIDSSSEFKSGRLPLWIKGYELFINNPFLGIGPGNLNLRLNELHGNVFDFSDVKERLFLWGHVENVYLTILYTYGVLVFLIFIYTLYYIQKKMFTLLNLPDKNSEIRVLAASLFFSWFIVIINMITNPAIYCDVRITFIGLLLLALSNKIIINRGTLPC